MRTMYDAVTATNIPRDPPPQLVAGYIDKITIPPWTAADWALFPHSRHVRIVKKASTNAGDVLDVEQGDATPAEAPGWARRRRAVGAIPTVYCSQSLWQAVQDAFTAAGEPQPLYWIAHYDGDPTLPTLNGITAVAKQHSRGALFDTSSVAEHWPGIDPNPATEDDMGDTVPAGTDEHFDFDLAGQSVMQIFCSYGRRVVIHQVTFVGDTPAAPAPAADWAESPYNQPDPKRPVDPANPTDPAVAAWIIDPNRPGPLDIPTRTVTGNPVRGGSLRYSTVDKDGKPDQHPFRLAFR
ncbi:glycoside hydrolase family 25 domain-containing protein [Amycolatopsis alkalitolerans]|uniref:hypothetical protein n=1 Tax=Amycolatopsis alkalitolerans TaxID=2547244 RepID=UPI00190F1A74|nr:hypothetical protein [Amycolatopsis alkalitolerans]